ncbi:MAG TPA: LPXTG cell wall anchor domain-containing protein [Vicinamibacterales bacterium]|nr:LPXTG cell wall anchor domain-containing protein [Vicinamibacterales bacterium]
MTARHSHSALVASALALGMVALVPAGAWAQSPSVLPDKGGRITLVGCFVRGQIKSHHKYVLVRPTLEPVASVKEARCAAQPGDEPIKLQDLSQAHLDHTMLGQWLEIEGRLEGNHRSDGIREVHVKSFRPVPVMAPRAAEAAAPPSALAPPLAETPVMPVAPTTAPVPQSVGTSGVREELPRTATSLPLFGVMGLVSLAAACALLLFDRRRTARS